MVCKAHYSKAKDVTVNIHQPGNALSVGQQRFFTIFLLLYLGMVIIVTQSEINIAWQALLALCAGGAIALMAHRKYGMISSILLVTHITIEWFIHARHGWHYSAMALTLAGTHTLFDGAFLFLEAKRHWGTRWRWWLAAVVVGVVIIFWFFYAPPAPELKSFAPHLQRVVTTHAHTHSMWQLVLVGGIIGCVVSHLWQIGWFGRPKNEPTQ